MPDGREWVLLVYRLPREPSGPRVAIWRRLRGLGVAKLSDGVVALPSTVESKERLEWVAEAVVESQGSATVWIANPASSLDDEELVQQLSQRTDGEYRQLIDDVDGLAQSTSEVRQRALRRLRRAHRAIGGRDYFGSSECDRARQRIESLVDDAART